MNWEEMQEELAPFFETLSKHKPKIILFLLVVAAAYYYLFLLAKPGSLTVRVMELDGGNLNDAEVSVEDGGKVLATELTSGGVASFQNLPSQKPLRVVVERGAAFETGQEIIEIPSAGQQSVSVKLERKAAVSFGAHDLPSTVPVSCADEFQVEVKNAGKDAFTTGIVAEEELAPILTPVEREKAVPAGSSTNFTLKVSIDPKATSGDSEVLGEKKGALRIKKTTKRMEVAMRVTSKLQLDVSPSEIFHTQNSLQKNLVTLSNTGEQTVRGIEFRFTADADLQAACGQSLDNCLSIESLGTQKGAELRPGDRLIIGVILNPPSSPGKKFLASLAFTGECFRKSPVIVPIRIELENKT